MKVLTIASGKGGVAKTHLAIQFAVMSHAEGRSTVLIDTNRQGSAANWAQRRLTKHGLVDPVVRHISVGSLDAELARHRLSGVKLAIIDTAGAAGAAQTRCIQVANLVVIPSRPGEIDLAPAILTLTHCINQCRIGGIVVTLTPSSASRHDEVIASLEKRRHRVCPVPITARLAQEDAMVVGLTIGEVDEGNPGAEELRQAWVWAKKGLRIYD